MGLTDERLREAIPPKTLYLGIAVPDKYKDRKLLVKALSYAICNYAFETLRKYNVTSSTNVDPDYWLDNLITLKVVTAEKNSTLIDLCRDNNIECKTFKGNWNAHGDMAGIVRDTHIINMSERILVISNDSDPRITRFITEAKKQKIPIMLYNVSGDVSMFDYNKNVFLSDIPF